jgi:hypothetical protein
MQGRSARVGLPNDLGDPSPKLTSGTQFRDGHELVVVGGEAESDLPQCVCNPDATFGERAQVGHPGRNAACQFP